MKIPTPSLAIQIRLQWCAILLVLFVAAAPAARHHPIYVLDSDDQPDVQVSLSGSSWIGTLAAGRLPASVPLFGGSNSLALPGNLTAAGSFSSDGGAVFTDGAGSLTASNLISQQKCLLLGPACFGNGIYDLWNDPIIDNAGNLYAGPYLVADPSGELFAGGYLVADSAGQLFAGGNRIADASGNLDGQTLSAGGNEIADSAGEIYSGGHLIADPSGNLYAGNFGAGATGSVTAGTYQFPDGSYLYVNGNVLEWHDAAGDDHVIASGD